MVTHRHTCLKWPQWWEAQQTVLPSYRRQFVLVTRKQVVLHSTAYLYHIKYIFVQCFTPFKTHSLVFNVLQAIVTDVGIDKLSNKTHRCRLWGVWQGKHPLWLFVVSGKSNQLWEIQSQHFSPQASEPSSWAGLGEGSDSICKPRVEHWAFVRVFPGLWFQNPFLSMTVFPSSSLCNQADGFSSSLP